MSESRPTGPGHAGAAAYQASGALHPEVTAWAVFGGSIAHTYAGTPVRAENLARFVEFAATLPSAEAAELANRIRESAADVWPEAPEPEIG